MKRPIGTLILFRGLMRETRHWGPFLEMVKAKYNVVAVDLPGVGAAASQMPPFSVFGMSEAVRKQVLKQNAPPPYGLLGVSLGGMVALEWAQNYPREVAGCIAINTSSKLSSALERLRWQVWSQFAPLPFLSDVKKREEKVTQLVINDPEKQKQAYELWALIAHDFKTHPLAFPNQMLAASKYLPGDSLKGSEDVLLLVAEGDRLVDPACSQVLSERYQWPMKAHPWGGHDLAWDDPEWILTQVQSFFA